MYAALHSSEHYSVETKEFPLTYVRLLYFCFVFLIVFQLEKTGEEHIDYMIMTNQLRSFNIHTTPLMIASEVSENPEQHISPSQ